TNGSAQDAVGRLIARLVMIYPEAGAVDRDPQSWPLCSQLTPHLLGFEGAVKASDWLKLLERAAGYFLRRAAYSQAAKLFRDALAIKEKTLGPEHPETGASVNDLAVLLYEQGDLEGARSLHERALTIRKKTLGPEHPYTADSLNNLANLLWAKGDLEGA